MFIKKSIFFFILLIVVFFAGLYFYKNSSNSSITESSQLIQQQIKNVGKLLVSEGHFAEILTFNDNQSYLGGLLQFNKKAIFVVNAEVFIAFNLHQIKYNINQTNKQIEITFLPQEEIKINTDIKFYDVEQSKFNPFSGEDYNKISKIAKEKISEKVQKSTLKTNAKNRLLTELSKILLTSQPAGWKVTYQNNLVNSESIPLN